MFRLDERERQRTSRARKQASGHQTSRAALAPEAHGLIDEFIESLRHNEELSRAGLRRKLGRLLSISPVKSDEVIAASGTE